MRLPVLLLASIALLLVVGPPPAQAGKVTPEQKRGLALVKDARRVGRSFRKAQKSANKAFGRASRKLAKDVNRGKTSGPEALRDWVSRLETLAAERSARREAAYAEYESLYASAGLSAGKTSVSIAGDEAAQRGAGTRLAGDAFHTELALEAREFGDGSSDAFRPIADACDADGCPVTGTFPADAPAHPTARETESGRPVFACMGFSDGTAVCGIEFNFPPPAQNGAVIELHSEAGGLIAIRSPTDAGAAVVAEFSGLEPGEYYFLARAFNALGEGESSRVCSFTIPGKPGQDPGDGDPGKSFSRGTLDGAPLGTPDVVGVEVLTDGSRITHIGIQCADRSAGSNSPVLLVGITHEGEGFHTSDGAIEFPVSFGGEINATVMFAPDGLEGTASPLFSNSGQFRITNLSELTDPSNPGAMTLAFEGTLDAFSAGNGTTPISFEITLSGSDLPEFPPLPDGN